MKTTFLLISLIAVMMSSCGGDKQPSQIYDYEDILTTHQESDLNAMIHKYQRKTDNEIIIVTSKDLDIYENTLQYALFFGNEHGICTPGKDNGLVIFVSKNMQQTALATGSGKDKSLKDEISKHIVDSCMVPFFIEEKYYDGIKVAIKESIKNWN
jgi:uncharacterized protein